MVYVIPPWPTYERFIATVPPWLEYLDWTTAQLARRTGCMRPRLSELLTGRRRSICSPTAGLIGQAIEEALARKGMALRRCPHCGEALPPPPIAVDDLPA